MRKSILSKAAEAEHLLCDSGNVQGGLRKLRELLNYIEGQTGKRIATAMAQVLAGYVNNLVAQVQAGQSVCA